jgi:hypothetical protein
MRYAVFCPGCDQDILVRLSVSPSEWVRFYLSCPNCNIPITGSMRGEDNIESLSVHFDDCRRADVDIERAYSFVVTVAPDMPLKPAARTLKEIGGAPSAMILHIAGDNAGQLLRRFSIFQRMRTAIWPHSRRFYEYYMQEQWDLFVTTGKKAVGAGFVDPGTAHGRESEAYRAVSICTLASATESFRHMMTEIIDHMEPVLEAPSFIHFATRSVAEGDLQREQRSLWDCLCLLMKISEMWLLPGLLWDLADENRAVNLDELSLSRDEFHQLRDAYITCFEASCKSLIYLLAFINTFERGDAEKFTPVLPPGLRSQGRKAPPRTFAQFKRLPNYDKLAYLYEWPILEDGLKGLLDNTRLSPSWKSAAGGHGERDGAVRAGG